MASPPLLPTSPGSPLVLLSGLQFAARSIAGVIGVSSTRTASHYAAGGLAASHAVTCFHSLPYAQIALSGSLTQS
jgi:hypothetical protein